MSESIATDPNRMLMSLAECSEAGEGVTRWPFTPEHRQALDRLRQWMQEAGLSVSLDDAGTLIGRLAGTKTEKTLLIGSHQDTVRGGGAFDGALGVIVGIAALARLQAAGVSLPFAVEVLAFADEEGVRFPTALMGPRALAGELEAEVLSRQDAHGQSIEQAVAAFGLNPQKIHTLRREPEQLLGYLEWHIEQGPVLESEGRALGVVTAICGIERHTVDFVGRAAHAGTTPMALRQDALVAAAEWVVYVNQFARAQEGLLATVGQLAVWPGVANAVAGRVTLTLEIRSADDEQRRQAARALIERAQSMAKPHQVRLESRCIYQQQAVPVSAPLAEKVAMAAEQITGEPPRWLPSGATHDASAMASLTDIAMLFVRCRAGVSHHPDEWAEPEDVTLSVEVLVALLRRYAADYDGEWTNLP